MNNILKRFISYLLYVVAFGYLVIKADEYHQYLKKLFSTTFDTTSLWLFASIFPIFVGLLIALPQFITVLKQKGSWKVDWIMLLSVGIPSLFVAITPINYLVNFSSQSWHFTGFIMNHSNLITIAGIVFGFTLISSLGRE